MITDFLLDLLQAVVAWVASLLPVDTVLGSQNIGFQIFSGANYFFPVSELASVLIGLIALGLPMAAASLLLWLVVGVLRGGSPKA